MKQEFTRIAVKVGSNVLTRRDGTLDVTRMSALVDQIAELHKAGVEVILISSGAVASGRSEIRTHKEARQRRPASTLLGRRPGKANQPVLRTYSAIMPSRWDRC